MMNDSEREIATGTGRDPDRSHRRAAGASGPSRRPSALVTAAVATLAAIAGFGAVYLTLRPSDNRAAPPTVVATSAASAAQPASAAGDKTGGDKTGGDKTGGDTAASDKVARDGAAEALRQGDMARFVFRDGREPLAPVSFSDASGKSLGLDAWKGRVVLLNLWATWCAPCRKEMPDLDRLQADLGSDRFEVVAVSLDRGSPEKARKFFDEIAIKSLAFYHDPTARLGSALKTIGMPTTLLIGADGREIGRLSGPAKWDAPEAVRLIKAYLPAG